MAAGKPSQKSLVLAYVRDAFPAWVYGYELRGKITHRGFLGHQADRRARELFWAGFVDRRLDPKGRAQYRARIGTPLDVS